MKRSNLAEIVGALVFLGLLFIALFLSAFL
jgi:hypothetical protein